MPKLALNVVQPDEAIENPFKLELNIVKEVSVSLKEESPDLKTGTISKAVQLNLEIQGSPFIRE